MTLNQSQSQQKFQIIKIRNTIARQQAIRLGLGEGSFAICLIVLKRGPIVVKVAKQQIAIGQNLAKHIDIKLANNWR